MRKILILLLLFVPGMLNISPVFAHDAVLLEWPVPTLNDDGTPISDFKDANGNANYIIDMGNKPGGPYPTEFKVLALSTGANALTLIPQLKGGLTYCFTIKAVNLKGIVSPGTPPEACATLDLQPGTILWLRATKTYSK